VSQVPVTIEHSLIIEADPDTVFGFLIDPRLMAKWFGISHVLEAKAGGTFRVEVSEGNIAIGVFTEVTPHRRVAFTWGWESVTPTLSALLALKPGTSRVEIDLEPHPRGTLLRLVHRGLPEDLAKIHRERWEVYLDRLAARLTHRSHKNENENNQADRDLQSSAPDGL
jgi:uncharacterized protein YndB with AHSA1/START domain